MKTHRQVALAIEQGRRFLKALKVVTEKGPVTKEEIESLCKTHGIYKSIPQGLVVSGALTVYEVTAVAVNEEESLLIEAGKKYLLYWKVEPDDEMAFYSTLMTGMLKSIDTYERFMLSCNLPPYSNCLRCDTVFPSRLGKKFCSDNCRSLHNHYRKTKSEQALSLKERVIRFLGNARSLIQSF